MTPDDPRGPLRKPLAGDSFGDGRYVLEAPIAQTGPSTMWVALDTQTQRRVLITTQASPATRGAAEELVRAESELLGRIAEHVRPARKPKKRRKKGAASARRVEVVSVGRKVYRVGRRLWAGDYTERHAAEDTDGGRFVLEVLRAPHRKDMDVIARFSVMSALRMYLTHPKILPFADLIAGGPLGRGVVSAGAGTYLSQLPLPLPHEIVGAIARDTGEALAYLERASREAGVPIGVHGNVDLDHLFVTTDGQVLVDGIGLHLFDDWSEAGTEHLKRVGGFLSTIFGSSNVLQ